MIEKRYPETSDYIHLSRAVRFQKFSKKSIASALNKLVSKDSYSKGDKKALISFLKKLSDMPEDGQNKYKTAPHSTMWVSPSNIILQQ